MKDQVFVKRENELARMGAFLERALAGSGQVCFIAGEPGSGKTTLMQEFARRSQRRHASLVVAAGDCSAHTGIGDAYLPFREVLDLLTGNVQAKLATGAISAENSNRLHKLLARSVLLILDIAPELIDTLVPCGNILSALGKAVSEQAGLEEKLKQVIKATSAKPQFSQTAIEQNQIFQQCTNYLCRLANEQPLIITLDDLQWADTSSVSLLFHLGRRIATSPILILGAYRPVEVALGRNGNRHPLEQVQAEFCRNYGDIVVNLTMEDARDIRRFIDAYVDTQSNWFGYNFREALCHYTEGNPLFLNEILNEMKVRGDIIQDENGRWMVGPQLNWNNLPTRIESVIGERIGRLATRQRQILSAASVEGQTFTAEVIARMESITALELIRSLSRELSQQHHLIEPAGISSVDSGRLSLYRFQHNLIHKYLYDSLDVIELAYLHDMVGSILEALYQDRLDQVAVSLAWHFTQAGNGKKAVIYLRRAGELAAERHAHEEALLHFKNALELIPQEDLAGRYQLLLARETIYLWQGKRDSQVQDLRALAQLVEQMKDTMAAAEVSLRWANFERYTGDYEAALAHAEQAVSLAGSIKHASLEAQGYAMCGRILIHKCDYEDARLWLQLARELAIANNDHGLVAQTTFNLSRIHNGQDHLHEARRLALEAQVMYQDLADLRGEFDCLAMIGTIDCRLGNYGAAWKLFDQALTICNTTGVRLGEGVILGNMGAAKFDLGDYSAAREHHEQALKICREIDDVEGEAFNLSMLGMVCQRLDDLDMAQTNYYQALEIAREIGDRTREGYLLTYLGYTMLELGDWAAAAEVFQEALEKRRELDEHSGMVVDDLVGLARCALAQADYTKAKDYAEEALILMETNGTERIEYPVLAYLNCFQVLSTSSTGNPAQAEMALQAGYELLQQQASRIEDPVIRRQFLENVPFNASITQLWEQRKSVR